MIRATGGARRRSRSPPLGPRIKRSLLFSPLFYSSFLAFFPLVAVNANSSFRSPFKAPLGGVSFFLDII